MATIQAYETKKGKNYKITVCCGYDIKGKKLVKTTTFQSVPGLTVKQQEKALQQFVLKFESKVKNGDCLDGEKATFEEFAVKWLLYVENNLAYSTYESYQQLLENKITPYFKGYKMVSIKTPIIEEFYKTMVNDYAYASIKKCANVLSGMFKTAIRWQIIDINPCSHAVIPRKSKLEPDIKFFTPQQSLVFLKSLDMAYETTYKGHTRIDDTDKPYYVNDYTQSHVVSTQYKVFYNISLFCGLRKGETLALHWNDINFDKKEIFITKSVAKTKDGADYKGPKTASSVRTVPLPEQVIILLKQYHAEYHRLRLSLGDAWKGDGNLFIQADGKLMGRSTTYHYFVRHLNRYNEWVGANKELAKSKGMEELPVIPLHGLRHSCATLLNYLGTNIIDIANVLGHSQTSTTMNIYAHSFEAQKKVVSNKINEFLKENA